MPSFVSEPHGKVLLEGAQHLRSNDLLFDYTLVAEGESLHVHKVVMAACSDYFRVLLCGEMRESKVDEVVLGEVKADTLRSLVNFAYTGELELSKENIGEIVSGVRYFQMLDALELCTAFLKQMLTVDNALFILDLAEKYALDEVQKTTDDLLLEEFEAVSKNTFLKLSEKQFMRLLGSNSLCTYSEYRLFEKTLSWIEGNPDLKKELVPEILGKIRYPLMSDVELSKVSQKEMMMSPRCQDLLTEAQTYHKNVLKQPLMQNERTQVRAANQSYIIAVESRLFCKKEDGYLEEMKTLYDSDLFKFEHIAVVDNFLYVYYACDLGDMPLPGTFERYDPRFNVWTKLPSLIVPRKEFPLVPFEQNIYAIGGVNAKTVEVFSIEKNRWRMLCPISFDNAGSAGVVFDDKIYITGGTSVTQQEQYSIVNCYTPATGNWEAKAPMIKARVQHHMVVVKGRIYAFGGMCDDSAFTVEYYSPDVDQWTLTGANLNIGVCGLIADTDIKLLTILKPSLPGSEKISLVTYNTETEKITQGVEMWLHYIQFLGCTTVGRGVFRRRIMMMPCAGLLMPHQADYDSDTDGSEN